MSDLVKALDQGARNVLVFGDVRLWVERASAEVEAWGTARCGLKAFNHHRFRVTDERAREVLVVARTVPMMADLRVVVLRDLEQISDPLAEDLLGYLQSPNPTTLLVLVAGTFPAAKKGEKAWGVRIINAVKGQGLVAPFKSDGVDRVTFTQRHAHALGIELQNREARLLVERVGADLDVLAAEVEKLAMYLGPHGKVTPRDLEEVCSMLAEEVIWELTGALARKDASVALRALHRLLTAGQDAHYLLAMISMQLRKVLEAQQRLRSGADIGELARSLKMRGAELEEVRRSLPTATPAVKVAEALARANRDLHGGQVAERALELLVLDLAR
jgi:DNA polymerase-3 subunit delta